LQLLTGDHIHRAEEEHEELIALCEKRNKRAAKALMHQHIVGVEKDLVEELSL
jgi:DNA-binding GntR family transcriptional regulator